MKNILLTIAYDGSRFHGWQRQPQPVSVVPTVQGYLEQTFSQLFRREIRLNGTSRTDAGVHALGQRASFQTDIGVPTDRLAKVLNNALCGREEGSFALSPVRILTAEEKPVDFHARFDCRGKKYIYRICTAKEPDIFRRNYVYHVFQRQARPAEGTDAKAGAAQVAQAVGGGSCGNGTQIPTYGGLDLEAMRTAAEKLVGTHDFKSFESAGGNPRQTTVRRIFDVRSSEGSRTPEPCSGASEKTADREAPAENADTDLNRCGIPAYEDEIRIEISGDGFLYNMVRIITGTLVEIGLGKRRPEEMTQIIGAKDRRAAGHTAPPYGLYLAEVYYDGDE